METFAPAVDLAGLPRLGDRWLEANPYRENALAAALGQEIFERACQRCHGPEGLGKGPAPNLRRLTAYCRRIENAELAEDCRRDADAYFVSSVLDGKVCVGVRHMPAWRGALTQEMVWSLRAYLDRAVQR